VIQSFNESNQKSKMLKDENFTKSSYSMTMKEFEHHRLIRKKNGDIMHREKKCTLICRFIKF
jgi:hypothetical protein